MIKLLDYENLLDKKVTVTCTDGTTFTGIWSDWSSAADNEPDPESIILDRANGAGPVELFVNEIASIQEAQI